MEIIPEDGYYLDEMYTYNYLFNGKEADFLAIESSGVMYIEWTFETGDYVVPPAGIPINEENFPDPAFRAYVLEELDRESPDGFLTLQQCLGIDYINVEDYRIRSLKGIEHFPYLVALYAPYSELTEIDLSGNPALEELALPGNGLTEIDLRFNPKLQFLDLSNNHLTSIDLSRCPQLTYVDLNQNDLRALDLTKNPTLCNDPSAQVSAVQRGISVGSLSADGTCDIAALLEEVNIGRIVGWTNATLTPEGTVLVTDPSLCAFSYTYACEPTACHVVVVPCLIEGEPTEIPISPAFFPDPEFQNYLLNMCDSDYSGTLSQEEIYNVVNIKNRHILWVGFDWFLSMSL